MSTIQSDIERTERSAIHGSFDSMKPGEQLAGTLVLLLVLILAILLQSL